MNYLQFHQNHRTHNVRTDHQQNTDRCKRQSLHSNTEILRDRLELLLILHTSEDNVIVTQSVILEVFFALFIYDIVRFLMAAVLAGIGLVAFFPCFGDFSDHLLNKPRNL